MSANRRFTIAAPLLVAALLSGTASAQSVTTQVVVGAGSATDQRGIRSNALTLTPSATFLTGENSSFALAASGSRFENETWQLGGGAAFAGRSALAGGFALTLNAGANMARTSFDATFGTADITPAAEWSWRLLTLYGGAHLASGYAAVSGQQQPLPLPGQTQLTSVTRTSTAPIYGGQLHFTGDDPTTGLVLAYREEPMRVADVSVTDRTASATVSAGVLTLAGSYGQRRATDENVDFSSGSASVAISSAASIDISGGRYPSSRLTGAAGGTYMSAGMSFRFGRRNNGGPVLPSPTGISAPEKGMTRLALRAPDASSVEVAGDWNQWTLAPATRAANGVWYADLPLAPGEYRYAFQVDGKEWRVPNGTVAVDDGFGGKSAYVTVHGQW